MMDNLELPMRLIDWVDKNKIDWSYLSLNENAIQLLRENPDKICWLYLSRNSNAIELLKENPDKINWSALSYNPNAIELLKTNPKKIDLYWLSQNSNAIELLREFPFNINWIYLFKNPNIFTYDYDKMRENMLLFKEDLMKERFHPRNLRKFGSWGHSGGIDDEDDELHLS